MFLGVLDGIDRFAVRVERFAECLHECDPGGEEVLRGGSGGALVAERCGHDGGTPRVSVVRLARV